jgi:hypothetical protein
METKRIEKMETWLDLKHLIIEKGYIMWQTQYDWHYPEGFHVIFTKGEKRLEVITHTKDIEDDMINSRMWRKNPPD